METLNKTQAALDYAALYYHLKDDATRQAQAIRRQQIELAKTQALVAAAFLLNPAHRIRLLAKPTRADVAITGLMKEAVAVFAVVEAHAPGELHSLLPVMSFTVARPTRGIVTGLVMLDVGRAVAQLAGKPIELLFADKYPTPRIAKASAKLAAG